MTTDNDSVVNPEHDIDNLRSELAACQTEIKRLRADNRELVLRLVEAARAMQRLTQ